MNSTIQIRVDKKTKEMARKKFKEVGLDLSSGIKCYLYEVAKSRKVPGIIRTSDGYISEENGKMYNTAKELVDDILKK